MRRGREEVAGVKMRGEIEEEEGEEEARKVGGGLEVSEAKLLHCVTIGVGWGEGKEEFARTHTHC